MSVLIKGIDLPEAYTSAWLTVFECVGEHTFMKTYKVSAEQIQAIPPHGRLIDADALHKATYHRAFETDGDTMWQSGCWVRYRAIEQVQDGMPTIIEAEGGEPHEQN